MNHSFRAACCAGSILLAPLLLAAWEPPALPEPARTPPAGVPTPADPGAYPDEAGFHRRAETVLRSLVAEDLARWRHGYFVGGDPGKYLPGAAMARLILDPTDVEARRYQNDGRSYREHYHFAAVNWARFYPLFGATVLTPDTRAKFAATMQDYNYLEVGGTENHRTMWMTSVNVLPHVTGVGTNRRSKEETLAEARRQLHAYVKGLYLAGPGEWDSSTYLMFTVNGLLNVYDFSPDAECRLLAQAGLDVLVAAYALKYTSGVFCGPNQRGHVRLPFESIADQTGYVWWGPDSTAAAKRDYRYAVHAITSAWRPGPVLTAIATRKLAALPAEQRNSKANYWFGQRIEPRAGASHETLWITRDLTMGSLWDAHASQHTRFMVAAASPTGTVVFTGGHPRQSDHTNRKTGLGFRDGTGRYVQSAQMAETALVMAAVPEDEEADYAYWAYPPACMPARQDGWFTFTVGASVIALHPLAGAATMSATPPDSKGRVEPVLKFPGRRTGFLVVVGGPELPAVLKDRTPDTSRFATDMSVSWGTADGRNVTAAFNPDPAGDLHGNRACTVRVNGQPLELAAWPIFGGPFVRQTPGRLEVSDGQTGFSVDFTGELPRYAALAVAR